MKIFVIKYFHKVFSVIGVISEYPDVLCFVKAKSQAHALKKLGINWDPNCYKGRLQSTTIDVSEYCEVKNKKELFALIEQTELRYQLEQLIVG